MTIFSHVVPFFPLNLTPLQTQTLPTLTTRATCMQAERRERDTQAIKTFEAGVAAISEEMEKRVLDASYALRDGLEEAEQAVAAVRGELDVDERLVEGDMAYVEVKKCVVFWRVFILEAVPPLCAYDSKNGEGKEQEVEHPRVVHI